MALNGHCICGSLRFEVEDAFTYAFYCHCSLCRRQTGSAFSAKGGIEVEKLRIVAGEEHLLKLRESVEGYVGVCARCFSPLYDVVRQRAFAHVPLGVLTDVPSRRPDHHIYVASKATWYTITDDLPQFDELPP